MRQKLVIRDDIIVDPPRGPIGISFSGGVESSLLVYLALKQLTEYPIHLFTVSVSFRNFNQHVVTGRVLEKICEITKNFNVFQHFTIGGDVSIIDKLFATPESFVTDYNIINSLLVGGNANPPDTVIKDTVFFKDGKGPMDRDRNPNIKRYIKRNFYRYAPFTNLNKQDIIQIYKNHGIDKSILPLTQSCWTDPPCNDCWFCFERNWGMQVLD